MKHKRDMDTVDIGRPYERCLLIGPSALSDAELLAVILRTGTKKEDAVSLAERVLRLAGEDVGLIGLGRLTTEELTKIPGIGSVKAIEILCAAEIAVRMSKQRARSSLSFNDPASIAEYYMDEMCALQQEELLALMLDTRNRRITEQVITKGTVNTSLLPVRELFVAAFRHGAVNLILVHNHPSGDPTPSKQDIIATRRVFEAGELLGIRLLDHLILGGGCYRSLREDGVIGHEWE